MRLVRDLVISRSRRQHADHVRDPGKTGADSGVIDRRNTFARAGRGRSRRLSEKRNKGIAITVEAKRRSAVIWPDPFSDHESTPRAAEYTGRGGSIHVRLREGNDCASVEIEDQCGGLPEGKTESCSFLSFSAAEIQRLRPRPGDHEGGNRDASRSREVSNLPGRGCISMAASPTTAVSKAEPVRLLADSQPSGQYRASI